MIPQSKMTHDDAICHSSNYDGAEDACDSDFVPDHIAQERAAAAFAAERREIGLDKARSEQKISELLTKQTEDAAQFAQDMRTIRAVKFANSDNRLPTWRLRIVAFLLIVGICSVAAAVLYVCFTWRLYHP